MGAWSARVLGAQKRIGKASPPLLIWGDWTVALRVAVVPALVVVLLVVVLVLIISVIVWQEFDASSTTSLPPKLWILRKLIRCWGWRVPGTAHHLAPCKKEVIDLLWDTCGSACVLFAHYSLADSFSLCDPEHKAFFAPCLYLIPQFRPGENQMGKGEVWGAGGSQGELGKGPGVVDSTRCWGFPEQTFLGWI